MIVAVKTGRYLATWTSARSCTRRLISSDSVSVTACTVLSGHTKAIRRTAPRTNRCTSPISPDSEPDSAGSPPNGPDTAGRGSAPAEDDTPDSSDQTRLSGFDSDGMDGADRPRDWEAEMTRDTPDPEPGETSPGPIPMYRLMASIASTTTSPGCSPPSSTLASYPVSRLCTRGDRTADTRWDGSPRQGTRGSRLDCRDPTHRLGLADPTVTAFASPTDGTRP